MSETERRKRHERQERRERGEESEESNRVSISTLSSQPRFDSQIQFGAQCAYRNAVANSICEFELAVVDTSVSGGPRGLQIATLKSYETLELQL